MKRRRIARWLEEDFRILSISSLLEGWAKQSQLQQALKGL
jgi:hypothetical protein